MPRYTKPMAENIHVATVHHGGTCMRTASVFTAAQPLCCLISQLLHQSDGTDLHAHNILRSGRVHGMREANGGIVPAHNCRSTFADSSCVCWYNLIRWQPAIRTCVRYGRVTKYATPLHNKSYTVTYSQPQITTSAMPALECMLHAD